jgi:hypothetical protein
LVEEYRSWSSSLWDFLHSPVTSSLYAQIFPWTPYSQDKEGAAIGGNHLFIIRCFPQHGYLKLKEEEPRSCGRGYGPVVRQTTEWTILCTRSA